ncbi:RNA polymerase recycling motor HelD [Paenibacillus odorifer]|uniref:RNA polymerase recycling motor HelD n=1 Tax=Paenibacillus TaxID=44249 RepID=UPI00096D39F6|nr:RNA polymerase recycling motor HelD [Paenibacillus odorifer]OMD12548.1 helicase [Paenibacillus odorifer]OMD25897.1 helicase [Paenibacillus odorifer]OME60821.1 helicase [Paenibacillus odorifer]
MLNEKDWQREQERLDLVTEELQSKIGELEPEVTGLREQVTDIRKRFWEEVTVNTSTHEDFEETFYSIKQQEALLSERERSHRQRMQRYKNMKRLLPSPYFGRMDFQEDGLNSSEQIYVGVTSFIDAEGVNFLVYDWRTPIASMYYDHSPGPASYDTPGGQISGTMMLKRQYQIRQGQLQNVFDTSLTIGDELLQQVLGKGADSQMKSIVATIQKEQNAIIRNDSSRMLIVQGAAGSGKTSAALQRVAYLLYKHRDRLKADQIVLFSPNPMFNSYVSTVLPELGEENMQQTTFQEYIDYWLGSTLRLEDPFEQIEYVLTSKASPEYEARLTGMQYKASEAFLHALQNYALWLGKEGMLFHSIRFRDRELITAEQMESQFYSYDSSIRLANRIVLLREWLLRQLASLERQEQEAFWVQDELDYLDTDQYAEAYSEILKKYRREEAVFDFTTQYLENYGDFPNQDQGEENVFDFGLQEEELLRRMIVKEHFKPLRRDVKRFKFIDTIGLYDQLFIDETIYRRMTNETELPAQWQGICKQTKEKLSRDELFCEDATPFLYLKELVEGTRMNTEVRHLFIDEGQDYSPFQYAFLKQLFPRARMTVLGDFGQAIFPQATNLHEVDSPLIRLYGEDETSLIRLIRSYRSTRQIVEFTKALLPKEEIVPFEREGEKPFLVKASSDVERAIRIKEDLAALMAEGLDSIAVITKTAAESRAAYEELKKQGCEALRLITKETLTFEKGILVIPAYLAKGVEFDAVLIYDASTQTYDRESERKLFYTACTRAMHRLLLYTTGDWSHFIQRLEVSLYEVVQ